MSLFLTNKSNLDKINRRSKIRAVPERMGEKNNKTSGMSSKWWMDKRKDFFFYPSVKVIQKFYAGKNYIGRF